jgi:hypothetical protein
MSSPHARVGKRLWPAATCHSMALDPRARGKTPGHCWSFSCHATQLLVLRWILEIFEPSTTVALVQCDGNR